MKNVNNTLLIIACLFTVGCEIYMPAPRPGGIAVMHAPAPTVVYGTDYCGYDPYEVLPHHSSPWACYSLYGEEYCEWVFSGHYNECVETWHYDWEWCEWIWHDETCYAI